MHKHTRMRLRAGAWAGAGAEGRVWKCMGGAGGGGVALGFT
jgi:hypothetical protein